MENKVSVNYFEYPASNIEIRIFEHSEFGKLRTVTIDEEIWFSGSDVMAALKHSATLLNYHVAPQNKMLFQDREAPGLRIRGAGLLLISKQGLEGLLSSGHLSPTKKAFKHWTLEEISPDIRAYSASIPNKTISFQDAQSFYVSLKMRRMNEEDEDSPTKWYSCTEIALRYGVSSSTVRNWIHSKKLKAMRIGDKKGTYHVFAADLKAFEQEYCTM